ncbi:MAG TPA: arylsulfatase [Chthonomonadaceae bacterium]|nr:arylsulfatase [Chthonomonadaceae bacterium]
MARWITALALGLLGIASAQQSAERRFYPVERSGGGRQAVTAHARRQNVVLFLADDMGYSDLGCYGGEVRTPNLDRLAREGLRFTQFYNTARCWPSRAAILTGYYAQQARRDTIPGVLANGAAGVRPEWARLLPDYLRPLGYRCYHSGKWHLDGLPLQNGFDRSYWLQDTDRHFSPRDHRLDDKPLPPVPRGTGYYSTTAIAGHAIDFLKEHTARHADQPFFAYVAFICPHFPLMAPPEDIAKYHGRFDAGWDVLRAQRLARMRRLGIVDCELSPRTPGVPAWSTLSPAERAAWSAHMEIHAAMVDRMDREIGRVMTQLRAMKALDDTAILFLSDNGASAEKLVRGDGNDPNAAPGSADSFLTLEPPWANLSNAPLRLSKIYTHEGGISTSLIVRWPQGVRAHGELRRTPAHVIDLAPTILEIAGGAKPADWAGKPIPPAPGHSIVPLFARDGAVTHPDLWWFHENNRAYREGDWKLVSAGAGSPWELYNLATDRGESHDLSARYPERVREMAARWQAKLDEFIRLGREER